MYAQRTYFSGVPPGITEKILRNIVNFLQHIQRKLHPGEEGDCEKFVTVFKPQIFIGLL